MFCWDPPAGAVGSVVALCCRQTTGLPLLGDLCDSRGTSKRCGGAVSPGGGTGGGLGGVVMRIEVVLWLFGAHNVVWVEGKRAQALPLLRGEGAVGCGRC